ncbi:MAG: diguanylate cyclase [Nitrospirae bacterium]|nr:diguanylate cyclase [Nitrospirota bacterium]MBI3352004.1 diguanylate cyclase [Nitrospirota bacterium]
MSHYDIVAWKAIQDQLAKLTGCSLFTYDTAKDPRLFCEGSQENPLCELIHKNPELKKLCEVEREIQIQQAEKSEQSKYFKCYANLNLFAIPLQTDSSDRKVLVGGQVYFSYQELEDFKKKTAGLKFTPHFITEKADEIKIIDKEAFFSANQLIESVALPFFKNLSVKKTSDNRLNKLNTLFNLCQELDQNLGERDFYGLFLNALGILFNGETVAVLKPDPVTKEYKTFEAFGNKIYEIAKFTGKKDNALFKKVLENRRPYATRDILEIVKGGFPEETGSLHLFPVGKPEKTPALLVFLDTNLSEEDIKLIAQFTHQTSVILENQFLFEALRNYRKDSKTLTEFSHLLVSTLDSEELFKTIIDQATSMLHAEQGSLMLVEEDTGDLKIKVIKGINQKIVEGRRIQAGEGVAGKVLQEGVPLLVQDMENDPRVLLPKRSRYKTTSFISVPITLDHRPIGILNVADKFNEPFFTEKDLQIALTISGYASMAIERSEFYRRSEELRQISITDPLSGLLNRRYFQERLAEEMERSKRHKLPLSLIIMDIDNFKQFNDLHGHLAGDEAIRIVGRCLRNNIRTIDVAARYGGEEFTVILPQTGKVDATQIAQRICLEIEKTEFITEDLHKGPGITVSLGLATFPEDAESIEDLFKHSDRALYMAKAAGKNRVVVYAP